MHDEAEIFRELAPLLRVRPEIKDICRFGAQWASQHDAQARGWAAFHIVTLGGRLLDVGNRVGIPLKVGDAVILPHGGPHTVRARSTKSGPTTLIRIARRLHDEILIKTNVDGEPTPRSFVAGSFSSMPMATWCSRLCRLSWFSRRIAGAKRPD